MSEVPSAGSENAKMDPRHDFDGRTNQCPVALLTKRDGPVPGAMEGVVSFGAEWIRPRQLRSGTAESLRYLV